MGFATFGGLPLLLLGFMLYFCKKYNSRGISTDIVSILVLRAAELLSRGGYYRGFGVGS